MLGEIKLTGYTFARPVPLLLLAYLAYEGGRHERRDLANLFWPSQALSEAALTPLAQDIAWRIERAFAADPRSTVLIALNDLLPEACDILASAHNSLKFHGFITDAAINGSCQASYHLTSAYLHQLAGSPLEHQSRNKLRNAVHKLRSIDEHLIVTAGRYLYTDVATDVAALDHALKSGDTAFALQHYRPFLARIEPQLTANQYQLGTDLSLWLSQARGDLAKRVQIAFLEAARQYHFVGQFKEAERLALATLSAADESNIGDKAYQVALDLLVAEHSRCVPDALKRFRNLGISLASDLNPLASEERLRANDPVESSSAMPLFNPGEDALARTTWRLSAYHLSSLIDSDLFDTSGRLVSKHTEAARRYNEALYVPPAETEKVTAFLNSEKALLVLVGKSGVGKSNLLCHSFLVERRNGNPALFLNARLLTGPDFMGLFKAQVLQRVNGAWAGDVKPLDSWLQGTGQRLSIYLDAINEYSGAGGALALLGSILDFANDALAARNLKLIIACRTETWQEFKEFFGSDTPLGSAWEESASGDTLRIGGFESEADRKNLFESYQRHYNLYPKAYSAQGDSLRQLIKTPFMMSVIAETYANKINKNHRTRIPRELDYLSVYQRMTERKLKDARYLLPPADSKGDLFEYELKRCLYSFATCLYDQLSGQQLTLRESVDSDESAPLAERSDALSLEVLADSEFRRFLEPFGQPGSMSPLRALVQLNLIEETTTTRQDFWGLDHEVKAYRFYHDQYAHYWLSAVLFSSVLGPVNTAALSASQERLRDIGDKVIQLLAQARSAPLLVGAVEGWLFNNMVDAKGVRDPLLVLFDDLVSRHSGTVAFYLGMYLHGLIEKNVTPARKLYETFCVGCGPPLKQALAYAFLELWPNVSPNDLRAFLEALDAEKDRKTISVVADILADLYTAYPTEVIAVLSTVLDSTERARDFFKTGLLRRQSFTKQLTFAVQFALRALHNSFALGRNAAPLRDFLLQRYNYLVQTLITERAGGFQAQLQAFAYRKLEQSCIDNWNQAVSPQGNNDLFFVADGGVVQRDVLYDYYRYVVALHNLDFQSLSFHTNEAFKEQTLQMLTFRPGSVLGYVAIVMAAALSANQTEQFDVLFDELLEHDTDAARISIGALATTAVQMVPSNAAHILELLGSRFVPHQLWLGVESEEVLASFFSVAAINLVELKPQCQAILDRVVRTIDAANCPQRVKRFGERLINGAFHPNLEVGALIVSYLLESKRLEEPIWREVTLRAMAGLLARSPNTLDTLLRKHGKGAQITEEARFHLSEELLIRKDQVNYQMSWNRFFAAGWSATKLRYYIVRDLLAGLIQANSVEEFAREYRRFFIEVVRGYLGGKEADYTYLTVDEALQATEAVRRSGRGKPWAPQEMRS